MDESAAEFIQAGSPLSKNLSIVTASKGRYGYLVNIFTTAFDFVLLNAVYLFLKYFETDLGEFADREVWFLLNISYIPAITFFKDVHNKRILFADKIMVILVQALIMHCFVMLTIATILDYTEVPMRLYFLFYTIFYFVLGCWWIFSRKLIKFFRRRGLNYRRVIIVGWNETARQLLREFHQDAGYGYRIVGIFAKGQPSGVELTGGLGDVAGYICTHEVDELYCVMPSEEDQVGQLIKIADDNDVQFYYVPMISGFMTTTFSLSQVGDIPALVYRPNPLQKISNRILKRVFDIVVSLIAIALVSATILIPVIIAIKLSSKGPILFKQKRTGYRGREFMCYKFRTMKVNADADTKQATKDDPRKTKVGDFLRRTSIDELPQFINVLLGNMSVVGPRPHMVKHTDEYRKLIDRYMVRHMIKPGITGLAQVSGYRGQTEELWQMEKRVEYDVNYIENWTFWLDVKIVIRTIYNAIHGEKNAF